jgi:amino acid adenylation domain-containing protein
MKDFATELGSLDAETKRALLKRLLAKRAQQRATDVLPSIGPDPASRHEPFPLTDVQQAYWVGRGNGFDLGQVSCHAYSELELGQIDLARLERAWQALVTRHDMLRTIVRPDGQQQILERVNPYEIHTTDARGWSALDVDAHISSVRRRLSHQVLPADRWPLFEICATLLDGGRTRLHTSLDLLVVDFWSIVMLVREWFEVYASPRDVRPPPDISFRDYVLAERAVRKTELYARSMHFWRERLGQLAGPPELPLAKSSGARSETTFVRYASRLEPDVWSRLKHRGAAAGLTSSSVLLAAFADILTTWSRSPRFTLNLTLFYRLPLHAQVNELVGDFTSVSFLDVDNRSRDSFEERAKRHQAGLWENLEHRYVSGIEVLRELARTQGGQRALMPVVFTSLLGLTRSDRDGGGFALPGQVVYAVSQTPQVWLDHQVYEQDGALVFSWDVRDDLFPPGVMADMFQAYCRLLHDLTLREESWQAPAPCRLPYIQEASQLRFNQTAEPIAAGVLHDVPGAAVANPTDVVLVDPRRSVTRGELDRVAAHLAGELRRLDVRPDSLVAIAMEKGWEELAAALGILRAGAAYLPVDPRLPRERFQQLLDRGGATIVLTQPWLDERLCCPAGVRRLVVSETILSQPGIQDEPGAAVSPDSLAYVLFTSGSTGEPKGVMIDHRAVVNTIADMNARFGVGPSDRFFGVSSLGFDLSVYDLFGAYAAGAATVLPRQDGLADPAHWFQLLKEHDVTVWNSVPVLMKLLVEYLEARRERLPSSLRLVLLSGDWIPVSLPDRIRALGEGIEVVSLGGATEASIWSIGYPIDTVDPAWPSVPYGRPLANQRFYVLNRALDPCPTWVDGDLYIGGVGLARGYWRDPERTDAVFIRHPVSGERLYRTGDRGRFLPSGEIEFLGREDLQVKVQGYRIELGEIEAVLRRHPAVRDVALAARADEHGDRRLIAGIVLPPELPAPSLPALREFVSERLPAYMVPSDIALVDRLPVNQNGKIDREALTRLAANASRPAVGTAPPPVDAVLTGRLTAIIAPMLGLDAIGADEDLVSLGATSVDIVRIANALEEQLGARPNIGEFYQQPTIAGLAASYASRARHEAESTLEPAVASAGVTAIEDEDSALIVDPAAREAFKRGQPGVRQDADMFGFVPLRSIPTDPVVLERHSQRAFAPAPIDFEALSSLMAGLRALPHDGGVKYPYPSAGGLYAVQAYLHVKEGRVDGLGGGLYYYQPLRHQLAIVSSDFEIDRGIHEPFINRPIYDAAAFSIFLIARLGAIRPLYGRHAKPFAFLEAGAMLQALMMTAVDFGVGLCPIGDLAFDRIRHAFVLQESDQLVHSLVGGRLPDKTTLSTA